MANMKLGARLGAQGVAGCRLIPEDDGSDRLMRDADRYLVAESAIMVATSKMNVRTSISMVNLTIRHTSSRRLARATPLPE
jgi:hypothetical protein